MTAAEYAAIAAACDRLLQSSRTTLARIAIPILHVINEHPGYMGQYRPLFPSFPTGPANSRPRPASDTIAVRAARQLVRSLQFQASQAGKRPAGRIDVLIVSRVANYAQLRQGDDFYFGGLQRLLNNRGATSATLLINHIPQMEAPPGNEENCDQTRSLLPRSVSPGTEARIWRQCLSTSLELRRQARNTDHPLDKAAATLAGRHALIGGTATNLRLHAVISKVCDALNPGMVITTYEGAAAERMIWHAARGHGRRPLCVGYQHAVLLPHAHAIRRPVGAPGIDCDPDLILTLGETTKDILAASPALSCVPMIVYGSHRRVPPRQSLPFDERPHLCLVLPDGDQRECAILFDFASSCARRFPQVTFLFRPHPGMSVSPHAGYDTLRDLPPNLQLSAGGSLEQDCALARYCLYRGSSAAMSAVLAGVKPFYLARKGELPFDPLSGLTDWHETVLTPEEFMVRAQATDAASDHTTAELGQAFCDRYIRPVQPAAIDELLDKYRAAAAGRHPDQDIVRKRPADTGSTA